MNNDKVPTTLNIICMYVYMYNIHYTCNPSLDYKSLRELCLFGDLQLNVASNQQILEATISYKVF